MMRNDAMGGRVAAPAGDQTRLPLFRALLIGQLLVTIAPGVLGLVAHKTLAQVLGYSGADPFVYGVYGAALLGYALVAVLGYLEPDWQAGRIPVVATLTFAAAAVGAAISQLAQGERSLLAFGVPVAGALAIPSCIYFLRRDEGDRTPTGPAIQPWYRGLTVVATIAAGFFGLVALLAPGVAPDLTGLTGADPMIFRLAGAATLGYAGAGVLEARATAWGEVRLQNLAAVVFNGVSAVVSLTAVATGNRSVVVLLILLASSAFAVALAYGQWQARVWTKRPASA